MIGCWYSTDSQIGSLCASGSPHSWFPGVIITIIVIPYLIIIVIFSEIKLFLLFLSFNLPVIFDICTAPPLSLVHLPDGLVPPVGASHFLICVDPGLFPGTGTAAESVNKLHVVPTRSKATQPDCAIHAV